MAMGLIAAVEIMPKRTALGFFSAPAFTAGLDPSHSWMSVEI
jgi:hypothetical protein